MSQNDWKKPVGDRVEGFKRFYRRENERPLLGFFWGNEYPLFRYPQSSRLPVGRPIETADVPVEPFVEDTRRLFEAHEACGGDFIFSATPFWGIPWLEADLGCALIGDQDSGSISTRPLPDFTGPESIPTFDPTSPWAVKSAKFFQVLAADARGRWPLATTRMRGISDLLAALYGNNELIFAMIDKPDEVEAVAMKLADFWLAWARFQLEWIPPFHGGIGAFYYYMWAPPGTVWHQEDTVALLNPDLYERFIAPHDRRIVHALKGCIMHQHPTGYMAYKTYLDMGFTALECHIDKGGASAEELYDVHCAILERSPLLIWGALTNDDLDWIFSRLPSRGLAVQAVVASPGEAKALWDEYAK